MGKYSWRMRAPGHRAGVAGTPGGTRTGRERFDTAGPVKPVYDRAMGLFRSRASKRREKAAKLLDEQTRAAKLLDEQTRAAKAQAAGARREVTAEARPDPDQPGWGRTTGQAIGRAREDHASQD
jgi:hypothetical protein